MEKSTKYVLITMAILIVIFIVAVVGLSVYIMSGLQKWEPVFNAAVDSGDVLNCNSIPDKGPIIGIGSKDYCIYKIAQNSADPELCKLMQEETAFPMSKNRCYFDLANQLQDFELCNMITQQGIMMRCKEMLLGIESYSIH